MEEKKTEMANKNAKKAKSLGSPLNQAHSGRIRLRDCYKSWICRRCEDEQYKLIIHFKEKNAILVTYPPKGSYTSTGLVVSSKLPRFSDEYTLNIASADPKSISAGKPVQFTKSVTQWFTRDGVLVEGLFWKDVEALINDYAAEPKKSK
ncbi:hypothetical protein OIU77_012503 [Salix suchowensis]|uniref:Signal peptidase complex subunit 2 n=1 Tax=Salix suchowensis TaxID=1278906 RepID=A0ABQ9A4Y4_9ROSI|nr:hypothetical protein OIU77_012503 [Salix suchowensis]